MLNSTSLSLRLRLKVVLSFLVVTSIFGCAEEKSDENTLLANVINENSLKVAMPTLNEETFLPWNGGSGRKFYLDAIYDYLVYIDPKTNELVPGLAKAWSISDGGQEVTLNLRQGVLFQQQWGEFTSQDVKFTLENIIAPSSRAGPASALRQLIKKIESPSDYEVIIHLNKPDIGFVRGYLTNGQQVPITSKRYLESVGEQQANNSPIGTGAYSLESIHNGSSIILKNNNGFDEEVVTWRNESQFGNLVFYAVPNEATRVAMVQAGELDIAPISYDSIQKLKTDGFKVFSLKQNWSPVIRMGGIVKGNPNLNNENVPWADKPVRQALNYAIDKQLLVDAIFHGEAKVAGIDFPSKDWINIPAYEYNPEKAKKLLAQAGFPQGFKIRLNTFESSPGADLPLVAEVVAQFWQAIGIDVTIIPVDWASLRGSVVNGKASDVLWTHRGLAFSNAAVGLQMSTSVDSIFATFADEHSEVLLRDISNTLEQQKRSELVQELGLYLHDQASAIFLVHANEPFAANPRLLSWPNISDHLTNFDQITIH